MPARFRPFCKDLPVSILLGAFLLGGFLLGGKIEAAEPADSLEFFENRIRPVLVKHCYECHSAGADEIAGSLVLDSSDGMISGGDSGPAIEPGDADSSMLISALRYESSEMPPDGKLPDAVIDDFQKWIDAGATDPRQGQATTTFKTQIDLDSGRKYWAFRPIRFAAAPQLSDRRSRGTIDQFVLDRQRVSGVSPNGPATPEARLRRLAFDLTGLPPTPSVQRRWLADPTLGTWHRIVDSMLASPAFAEHWARHWMDVARYADSNGADFNATHHEAWRYRDYLIRALADDTPFDKMIRQQIAGDLLPASDDRERHDNIVASTFLMLGTKMLSERDKPKLALDVVDEQIDTVGRAFLGLTLGCARCHDHKFDPVPTEDYYALAGIFRSTVTLKGESQKYVSTWNRVPLPTTQAHVAALQEHGERIQSFESRIQRVEYELKSAKEKYESKYAGFVVDDSQAEKVGYWKSSTLSKQFVGEGYVHDNNEGKGTASIRFTTRLPKSGSYEVRLSHSAGSNRAAAIPVTIATASGEVTLQTNQQKIKIEPHWSSLGKFEFSSDQDAVVTLRNGGTSGYVIADAVQFLPEIGSLARTPGETSANKVVTAHDAKREADQKAKHEATVKAITAKLSTLKSELAAVKKSAPRPLPVAMAPSDHSTDKISDSPVQIRGEVTNVGAIVPRGFLQVLGRGDASMQNPQGSGRIELADWLTDPDNPLVSRVFVNRVWMHLMGEGLVRTVDNFGAQGERPTHPDLLDALATQFVRGGWRIKPLIRNIVLSAAYQRSSDFDVDAISVDPENRLLWRMNRRRIPAESIRDAMLVSAGVLDRAARSEPMRGRGTLVSSNSGDSSASFDDVSQACRSIYLPIVRGYMPPLLMKLDAAEPDLLVGKRPTTNVPAQALVLLNSPDVNRWAEQTAARVLAAADEFDTRLEHAFRLCIQRQPRGDDRELAERFFARENDRESLQAWHEFVAGLMASTEFRLLE